jgi:hypothetical protein
MEIAKMPPLLMNGLRKCGIYAQWNFIQSQTMKFCHLQVNGNWRTSSKVKLARFRRPKATYILS